MTKRGHSISDPAPLMSDERLLCPPPDLVISPMGPEFGRLAIRLIAIHCRQYRLNIRQMAAVNFSLFLSTQKKNVVKMISLT